MLLSTADDNSSWDDRMYRNDFSLHHTIMCPVQAVQEACSDVEFRDLVLCKE